MDDEFSDTVDMGDQQISVSATLDDNGHSFLILAYSEGEGCHGVCSYDMIAKKQRYDLDIMEPAHWEGLTDEERERLGINLTYSEIEQMATRGTKDNEEDEITDSEAEVDEKPLIVVKLVCGITCKYVCHWQLYLEPIHGSAVRA